MSRLVRLDGAEGVGAAFLRQRCSMMASVFSPKCCVAARFEVCRSILAGVVEVRVADERHVETR